MARPFKYVSGTIAVMVLLIAGLYAYRSLMLYDGRTPEGYPLLTAMPGAQAFQPPILPPGPMLSNKSSTDLTVDFGYKVGGISYSYTLDLVFPAKSETGQATIAVQHGNRGGRVSSVINRRWDAPRNAYSIALENKFDLDPAVPALCVKAVIGPSESRYDLKDASLCVAQRDMKGLCHVETLACGLIR